MKKSEISLRYFLNDNSESRLLNKSGLSIYLYSIHKIIWGFKLEDISELPKNEKARMAREINDCLSEILSWMLRPDKDSNCVLALDKLYRENLEYRSSFMMDFHEAFMRISVQQLWNKNPQTQKQFAGTLVNQTYSHRKQHEDKNFSILLAGKKRTEQQVYALASFYAVDLALIAYQENDAHSLSRLQSDLYRFSLGPDYSDVYGGKGGRNKPKESLRNKKRAKDLYFLNNFHDIKNMAAAQYLTDMLEKEKISVSKSTLETDWIPEFKKSNLLKNKGK